MSGSKILPAIFLVAPTFVLLMMRAGVSGPAAEHCRAHPGVTTPPGAHWYYVINRADKRRCWFLGSEQARAKVRAAARAAPARTSHRKSARSGKAAGVTAQAASAHAASAHAATAQAAPAPAAAVQAAAPAAVITPVVFLQATLAAQEATDFIARWPRDLPSARDLNEAEPQTLSDSYADRGASEDRSEAMPSWPSGAVPAQEAFAGEAALRTFSLACGLAIPLVLLIGWAAKFMRPPHRLRMRDQWRAIAGRLYRQANLSAAVRGGPAASAARMGQRVRPEARPPHRARPMGTLTPAR